jgi:hypothetical protein
MKERDRKGEGKDGKGRKLKTKAYEKELRRLQAGAACPRLPGGRSEEPPRRTHRRCGRARVCGPGRGTRAAGSAGRSSRAGHPAAPKPATLGLFVYPGKGQDAAKQGQDENECYLWARGQTGIDPTAPPTQAAGAEASKGGAVKGAAKGAAKGYRGGGGSRGGGRGGGGRRR